MRMFFLLGIEYLIYAFIDIVRGLDLKTWSRLWLLGPLTSTNRCCQIKHSFPCYQRLLVVVLNL